MHKPIVALIASILALGLAADGLAKAKKPPRRAAKLSVSLDVGEPISLATRDKEPTFVSQSLQLMDRGALVFVGKGMWKEQHRFFFRQLADQQELIMEAPLAKYLAAHPDQFPGSEGSGFPRYLVEGLPFVDRTLGLAGIALEAKPAKGTPKAERVKRQFLMLWDLKENAITEAIELARQDHSVRLVSVIGVDSRPDQSQALVHVQTWLEGEANIHQHKLMAFGPDGHKTLATFETKRDARRAYLAPGGDRLLVAEYAELAQPEPPPLGHLVDLATGAVQTFAIPMTAYGAAFAPDGQIATIYSNQARVIWQIALPGGKKLREVKVGGGGHALAYGPAGRLMLLSHRGLTFLDPHRLTRSQHIPIAKVFSGQAWVPGSLLTRDRAIFKNGDDLVITRLVLPASAKRAP